MEGIPGISSDSQHQGMLDGFAEYPDITVVAEIAHMWTPQIAQAELQKWLSANTTQVDGFAVQSSGESGALNALESSGRDMVPMALGGEIGAFCYWRNNPDFIDRAIYAWPPETMLNLHERSFKNYERSRIKSIILVPPYEEDVETIQSFVPEDCDRNSSEFRTVGIENWASDEYLNNFLIRRGTSLINLN